MHRIACLLSACVLLVPAISHAEIEWPGGAPVAVVLTYDDALASQLDHAVPALEERGLKGTFYLSVGANAMLTRMPEWRAVAGLGHELGNHTVYHPCSAQGADRGWVEPHNDLDRMTVARVRRELEVANTFLQALDGNTRRTYAATCYDRLAGGEFYWPEVVDLFAGFRDLDDGMPEGSKVVWGPSDPATSGAELIRFVTDNSAPGSLVVFVFHGVGGDHLSVTPAAHAALLDFLVANDDRYWVDTYLNVVDHVAAQQSESIELRTAFADHFLIGAALSADRAMAADAEFDAFVAKHFNAITAENAMKWERIHPAEGEWNWEPADRLVEFAAAHDMHLTGHTLVWHQQTPDWVFEDADGNRASRELLLARMKAHIEAVVGRYKGRVPSWDVVNEGIDDSGAIRDNVWREIIGDDYLEKAFEFTHAADPDAILFYNDYNMFTPERRAGTVALVERLRARGVPVHGIGMQGHMRVDYPENLDGFEASVIAFAELGLEVAITELDVSVLPWPGEKAGGADIMDRHAFDTEMNPYADGLTTDAEAAFNQRYLDLFDILLRHSDKVSRVTFWGVNDADSWRNDWPMRGRTDYPLLVDRDNVLKPVWRDILALRDRD